MFKMKRTGWGPYTGAMLKEKRLAREKFTEDDITRLQGAIIEYERDKWKVIAQKMGVSEQV
ncbi:hypothetical protein TrVFT333_000077 [Trichoderma virens FT-333]|nr:hypothetical protein TrVFT333_000077 [Trichoderma virens FT-333]